MFSIRTTNGSFWCSGLVIPFVFPPVGFLWEPRPETSVDQSPMNVGRPMTDRKDGRAPQQEPLGRIHYRRAYVHEVGTSRCLFFHLAIQCCSWLLWIRVDSFPIPACKDPRHDRPRDNVSHGRSKDLPSGTPAPSTRRETRIICSSSVLLRSLMERCRDCWISSFDTWFDHEADVVSRSFRM